MPADQRGIARDPLPFYEDRKRGWYWYEEEPEKPEEPTERSAKQEPKLPSLSDYTYEQLWNMYPDDFQELLNVLMKKAVQNPTENNIMEYLTMQDIARRKAVAYAAAVSFVTQKHPELTTEDVYPITTPGQTSRVRAIAHEIDALLYQGRNEFALVMFVAEGCGFCEAQQNILEYFVDRYRWEVRTIDVKQNPSVAARFNVTLTPSILLVASSGKYMPVSVGVISYAELRKRLYRSIRYLKGEIKAEQWFMYDFEKGKSTDPLGLVTMRQTRLPAPLGVK